MNRDDRENEICRAFDERAKQVNINLARLELAEALAREEENSAQKSARLTASRRWLILSVFLNAVYFSLLVAVAIGGN